MTSFNPAASPRPAVYGTHVPPAVPTAPAGTFAPGTKIQVGSHKVVIQKYFSEGGFAHVYLVKMPKPIDGTDIAVLKRVAVPDKENLANMRTEVETMKKLKGHRPIVTYYDSHASQLKGGGYEVFLLMEFCNGGGLIDFMNTRLQNRLSEPEILKIFSDVTEGVACMHYLKPPLLHRDLKVENVLITSTGSSRRFKLCDFGSTAPPRPAATNVAECRLIEDDVQKHTTLQYRSPEMIDVYRKLPIDEKSDIWALGVLLYKLCYYTTPFEEQGQLAILNASFKFPSYPSFSDRLKKLIANMLREKPKERPNVYQVLKEACLMQGIEVPIKDIYAGRSESESRRNQQLPPSPTNAASPPAIGAVFAPPAPKQNVIPDVVPMRRGRPTTTPQSHVAKPSPSPMRGTTSDPFAALDAKSSSSAPTDELTSRFPSLDHFSLLHDHGAKFEFDATSPTSSKPKDLSQRVTEKLADNAFISPPQSKPVIQPQPSPSTGGVSKARTIISSTPAFREATSKPSAPVQQPIPIKPSMVSTGTMTSPASTPPPSDPQTRKYTPSPIWRVPQQSDHHRSSSLPRDKIGRNSGFLDPQTSHSNSIARISPQQTLQLKHTSSSRPSLEGGRPGRPHGEFDIPGARPQPIETHSRPASTYLESNMDYLREREAAISSSRPGLLNRIPSSQLSSTETAVAGHSDSEDEPESNIESNIDFLRSMEDQDSKQEKHRRTSSGAKQAKRSSLPSMSLTGTKNLLAGKFGDAFKRFENNTSVAPGPRTPSPLQALDRRDLTPIAGSEATDGRSDDGLFAEDAEDLPPEQRREIERRRLSMEEKRVANAAAEYRKRLAERDARGAPPKSIGGVTRAASIQNKVKTLLDENLTPSPTKTVEGYGRFTDSPIPQVRQYDDQPQPNPYSKPIVARKPITPRGPIPPSLLSSSSNPRPAATASAPLLVRPAAPPKPTHLNSLPTGSPPNSSQLSSNAGRPGRLEHRLDMTPAEKEDYVADFSKRFPSLSGIEMVESAVPRRSEEAQRAKPSANV